MSGACKYCGRPTFDELGISYHVENGTPAQPLLHEDMDGRVYPPSCKIGHRWDESQYAEIQKAYGEGEYDGYWRQPQRDGEHSNPVWVAYLRGYLAGVRERALEPSDEQIDAWMKNIAGMDSEGNR